MLLMIDNYDSFTYNLAQYFGELGQTVHVVRNDAISPTQIAALQPTHIVISPGPGRPEDAGVSLAVIAHFAGKVPILGVCLGHQAIGHAFGGRVHRAQRLMHGKVSEVYHNASSVFQGVPSPVRCTRYHSLALDPATLPQDLHVTGWTQEGEIMGIAHRTLNLHGVQFHPESMLTEYGHQMLHNFLAGLG